MVRLRGGRVKGWWVSGVVGVKGVLGVEGELVVGSMGV